MDLRADPSGDPALGEMANVEMVQSSPWTKMAGSEWKVRVEP